jgi:hypothetical protein
MPDLETNGNLIFLGSSRSNPWTSIYDPVLDFHFVFDEPTQQELIRNMKPAKGERNEYIPTAGGFDTGQSFATVSIFQNPGHTGKVLIIAGANGEGTEAAGALITDPCPVGHGSATLSPYGTGRKAIDAVTSAVGNYGGFCK